MDPTLRGIASVVRVVRTPLGVIALGLLLPVAFSIVIFLFAPIPDIAKYVVGGLPWVLFIMVWLQFWSKARHEPLSVSETYYIEQLRYNLMGTQENPRTIEEIQAQLPQANPEPAEIPEKPEQDENQ